MSLSRSLYSEQEGGVHHTYPLSMLDDGDPHRLDVRGGASKR